MAVCLQVHRSLSRLRDCVQNCSGMSKTRLGSTFVNVERFDNCAFANKASFIFHLYLACCHPDSNRDREPNFICYTAAATVLSAPQSALSATSKRRRRGMTFSVFSSTTPASGRLLCTMPKRRRQYSSTTWRACLCLFDHCFMNFQWSTGTLLQTATFSNRRPLTLGGDDVPSGFRSSNVM